MTTVEDTQGVVVPAVPYRGIQPFRYADHSIFFEREEESARLASLVAIHRGVFLYGDSGNGKSSLLNAGLLPRAGVLGLAPIRLRVHPRAGQEIVVESIVIADDGSLLPNVLGGDDDGGGQLVLPVDLFVDRVRAASDEHRLLLVFDQFEELVTLFEYHAEARDRIVAAIHDLLDGPASVKLLFAFREDYLGRIKQLLAASPELVHQALRLGPPDAGSLPTLIRGPFERHPGHFERELDPALAERLRVELEERFGSGELSLSEIQVVCLRLWGSSDPDALLDARGVQGTLEDYLGEALDRFDPEHREAAVALLAQMVTAGGTRNVVSAEDLVDRVRAEDDIPGELLSRTLDELEGAARLVRRERRRDLYLYEITSEFLVPWISRRREEVRRAREHRRERRRLKIVTLIAVLLGVVVAAIAALALSAVHQRKRAERQQALASALALASSASRQSAERPDVALALAFEAYRSSPLPEARGALIDALHVIAHPSLKTVLHGHTDGVSGVAFSPDARTLATSSRDGTAQLWDVRTGMPTATLRGHTSYVYAVAYSPDGRVVATASRDATARLWDAHTGKPIRRLVGHRDSVTNVAFAPDGRTVATVSNDGTLRLWNARSGKRAIVIDLGFTLGPTMAFSPDGRSVATADVDNHASIRDARTGRRRARLEGHRIAFSPDGRTVATASPHDTARTWDALTGRPLASFAGHRGYITAIAFSPDGRSLATSSRDHTVRLWSLRTGTSTATLRGHAETVTDVQFSPDGAKLASASVDATVRIWDARTGAPLDTLRGHTGGIEALAFDRNGGTLATGSADTTARLWNLRAPRVTDVLRRPAGVYRVAFTADGRTVATAGEERAPTLWRASTGRQIAELSGARGRNLAMQLDPSGRYLAASDTTGITRLWEIPTGNPIGPVRGHLVAFLPDGPTLVTVRGSRALLWRVPRRTLTATLTGAGSRYDAAISRDGRLIALGDSIGGVEVWDTRTRKRTITSGGMIGRAAFGPDGATLAVTSSLGTKLLDLHTGRARAILHGHTRNVYELAYSPDGRILATGGADHTVRLWDARSGTAITVLRGHTASISGIAFSPDGSTLATSSVDGTARLWDPLAGKLTTVLTGHTSYVNAVSFSPDGRTLATASSDRTTRLWRHVGWRDGEELRNLVCGLLGRGLSRAEWVRYLTGISYRDSCM